MTQIEDLQRSKALLQANMGVIHMERTLAVDEVANTRQYLSEEALNHKKTITGLESVLSSYRVKVDRLEVEKEILIQNISSMKVEKAELEGSLLRISNSSERQRVGFEYQIDEERQQRHDLAVEKEAYSKRP